MSWNPSSKIERQPSSPGEPELVHVEADGERAAGLLTAAFLPCPLSTFTGLGVVGDRGERVRVVDVVVAAGCVSEMNTATAGGG
eukprot:5425622-Amphidinium_carterae.1